MPDSFVILAIEDDEADFKLLSHTLKQIEFKGELLHASSAEAAYRLLAQRMDESLPLPKLILLDLGLPDETGMEILRKFKSAKVLSGMKVVMFSGSKSTNNMAKAKELGAVWYFVKPDNPADMRYIAQELVRIARE